MKKKVKSISELKKLSCRKDFECHVLLNFNLISRKTVQYNPKEGKFRVWHHIDETVKNYSERALLKSNIGLAIEKGSLIYDEAK